MRPSSWLPPAVWMAVIALLSSGWFASRRTEGAVAGLLAWVVPWLTPEDVGALHGALRKLAHLAEYAILALLWFRALARDTALSRRMTVAIAFAICVGWAALDELHQSLVAGRTGSAGDVAIDATGALAALAVARRDWLRTARALTTLLLWVAAAGGAIVLAIDWATGVPAGYLWLTAPAAALVLVARRWALRPSGEDRACRGDRRQTD